MKTQNLFKYLIVAAAIGTLNTSCKKKETTTPTTITTTDDSPEQKQTASDQIQAENETNYSLDDVNAALNGTTSIRTPVKLVCNATIDTSMARTMGMVSITYNGKSADSARMRTGTISIQLPYNSNNTPKVTRWSTEMCSMTITYSNYTVTNVATNKSITLNGTHTITNLSGGTVATITNGINPIIHKIRGSMTLTFDDGTQRSWSVARKRTFNYTDGITTETLSGDTTVNNYSNVAMWGINRKGDNFYVSTTTPLIANVSGPLCLYKPIGVRVFYGAARTLTVTYGVDQSGNSITGSTCPYGYKLDWVNVKGENKEAILAY
jgi:hypothetical protein